MWVWQSAAIDAYLFLMLNWLLIKKKKKKNTRTNGVKRQSE